MGYANLKHFEPGIEGWIERGGPIDSDLTNSGAASLAPGPLRTRWRTRIDRLVQLSTFELLLLWLLMVGAFAGLYWLWALCGQPSLLARDEPVSADLRGFFTCLYFSFVTATSVGFGDVVPTGLMRAAAVIEAATELLLFGVLISRFIGRRQDQMIQEIHQLSFEDRLGRVRVNLHLVLTELQELAEACSTGALSEDRLRNRWESLTRG